MVHCNCCVPSYNSFRNVINLHCYRIPKDPKLPGTVYMSFLSYNNRKSFFKSGLMLFAVVLLSLQTIVPLPSPFRTWRIADI